MLELLYYLFFKIGVGAEILLDFLLHPLTLPARQKLFNSCSNQLASAHMKLFDCIFGAFKQSLRKSELTFTILRAEAADTFRPLVRLITLLV